MRRCDLAWPEFPEAADHSQYLLGDDLLIAPILEPAHPGKLAERTLWIPPGEWEDLWSGQTHRGPVTIGVTCGLGEYPVFARHGGLILSAPQRESTGIAVWPEIIADVFVSQDDLTSTRVLYEDDGCSTAYASGACALTEFTLRQQGAETELSLIPRSAPEGIRPQRRRLTVRIHLPHGSKMRSVWLNGRVLDSQETVEIAPTEDRALSLFPEPSAPPPSQAGPVVEWCGEIVAAEALKFQVVHFRTEKM